MNISGIGGRVGKAFAALLMWAVFGAGAIAVLVGQLVSVVLWLFTGSEALRLWVLNTGKGTDAINNAAWLGGSAKETISSHAGRYYETKYGNPYKGRPATIPSIQIPLWARAVKLITDLFEHDHVLKAVEPPFLNEPL